MELVDLPAEADLFQYIAERICELVPEGRVMVHSFDEVNRQMILRAMEDDSFREDAKRVVGRDLPGTVFPITDLFYSAPFNYTPGCFVPLREFILNQEPGGDQISFYDLCAGLFPREVCDIVVHELNLGKMYGIGLVWQDQVFGITSIFLSPEEELHDREAFESFIRQASIAIARRQTEERLRRSERRLREVIESSPHAAALIDADGRYLSLNRRFTEVFGYTIEDIPTGEEWFRRAFPDGREEANTARGSDPVQADAGEGRPRTYRVRCKNGEEKAVLFRAVGLCDGTQYVTCEDVTGERRACQMLAEEIAELRQHPPSP